MSEHGTIAREGDTYAVRYERRLTATPREVWSALTEPARLAEWLATVTLVPGVGGEFLVDFGSGAPEGGRITAWDPERTLAFEWRYGDDPISHVEWTLTAVEDGAATVLTLVHSGMTQASAPSFGAGWHGLLDRLEHHLGGPEPTGSWEDVMQFYELSGS